MSVRSVRFRDNKSMAEILAEAHTGVMQLPGIQAGDADLNYIASQGRAAVSDVFARLEKINSLPKPASFFNCFCPHSSPDSNLRIPSRLLRLQRRLATKPARRSTRYRLSWQD